MLILFLFILFLFVSLYFNNVYKSISVCISILIVLHYLYIKNQSNNLNIKLISTVVDYSPIILISYFAYLIINLIKYRFDRREIRKNVFGILIIIIILISSTYYLNNIKNEQRIKLTNAKLLNYVSIKCKNNDYSKFHSGRFKIGNNYIERDLSEEKWIKENGEILIYKIEWISNCEYKLEEKQNKRFPVFVKMQEIESDGIVIFSNTLDHTFKSKLVFVN